MTRDIKHFFSDTAESGAIAVVLVKELFASTHPEDRINRVKTVADELERFVVCVSYGAVASPSHAFYAVSKQDRSISVIEDDALYRPKRED